MRAETDSKRNHALDKRRMRHTNWPGSIVVFSAACIVTVAAAAYAPHARAATIVADVHSPAGGGVADAVVYAVPAGTSALPRPRNRIAIEQVDREFLPYVSAVQAGTVVTFPNRDPILHHVYSFSRAKPFEIKLYSGASPIEVVFDQPGVVTLGCNIHDWMIAYVLVVETPYFAKTDAAGHVQLANVPAGNYELKVWHPTQKGAGETQAINIPQGGAAAPAAGTAPAGIAVATGSAGAAATVSARFVLDTAPRKLRYKPPMDKMRY